MSRKEQDSCRRHDLDFIVKQIDEDAINRLEHVANTPFKRLSYTDAIIELQAAIKEKRKKFENPVPAMLLNSA